MNMLLRLGVLLWWVHGAIGNTQSSTTTSNGAGDTTAAPTTTTTTTTQTVPITASTTFSDTAGLSAKSGNATCPSRTVNYITHTLPRQCLRTDRVPHNTTQNASTNTPETASTQLETSSGAESTDAAPVVPSTPAPVTKISETDTVSRNTTTSTTTSTVTYSIESMSTVEAALEPSVVVEEADSPLDNANFLSFEEWKKQNLAKTGQSPDDVGNGQPVNPNRPRPGINNALDSLGEESEINLDFSGFGGAAQAPVPDGPDSHSSLPASSSDRPSGSTLSRSKDAGKTCKERTNYASFDCSATVLKSNKECKSASSVLVENKDNYMLNKCSADNKFFIVELCDDIQIDTIVLANYEFFSSSFRHFRVSVSDRYPVKMEKWKELGTFEAMNVRDIQAFLVENPLIWAKYLRIEFLTHYGTEYYCPVSLLRVHGTTMIEDYRHAEDLARGEHEEEATLEAEALATPAVAQEPAEIGERTVEALPTEKETVTSASENPNATDAASPDPQDVNPADTEASHNSTGLTFDGSAPPMQVGAYEPSNLNMTCQSPSVSSDVHAATAASSESDSSIREGPEPSSSTCSTSTQNVASMDSNSAIPTESSTSTPAADAPSATPSSQDHASGDSQASATTTSVGAENSTSLITVTSTLDSANSTNVPTPTTNATRSTASSSVGSQPPQPSTQESFFKSFAKRLTQLESNSTLSLQYIEEQSRILRDAFSKVEKRQLLTTSTFLSQLNETVMSELHGFRQAYDQLWQSTVIELEGQREAYQREMLALSSRLTLVADELVWQKRLGIVQSTLLLLCLALVLFGRGSNGYMEMPLMQHMMNRSTAALRAGWESPPNSPSPDSRSPVSIFRRKLWRSKTEPTGEVSTLTDSEVSRPQSKEGPEVLVQPPSPASRGPQSDYDDEHEEDSSPNGVGKAPMHLQSSPKKSRKKHKKLPSWPRESGMGSKERPKSPLAL